MAYEDKEKKREYDRNYYKKHREKINARRYLRGKSKRKKLYEEIGKFKSSKGCCVCKEDHPACLTFHHKGDDKEINISDAVRLGWSKTRIFQEIEKCNVMCSNCHMKLHWEEKRNVAQFG